MKQSQTPKYTEEIIIEEWHLTKNEKPLSAYKRGSHEKGFWKCGVCNHVWEATIANRLRHLSGCPECRKLKFRGKNNPKWTGFGDISGLHWLSINREAKRRNLEVTLTIKEAWKLFELQEGICPITGRQLIMWGKIDGKKTGTASLDRKNSSRGYFLDNVQWIHKDIQLIKRNIPDDIFIDLCKEITAHHNKKKLEEIPSFKTWLAKVGNEDLTDTAIEVE